MITSAEYIESPRKLKTEVYMLGKRIDNWENYPMIEQYSRYIAMSAGGWGSELQE